MAAFQHYRYAQAEAGEKVFIVLYVCHIGVAGVEPFQVLRGKRGQKGFHQLGVFSLGGFILLGEKVFGAVLAIVDCF